MASDQHTCLTHVGLSQWQPALCGFAESIRDHIADFYGSTNKLRKGRAMIPKRSILIVAMLYLALSLSGPTPGVAQTLSARSVVKWPIAEGLGRATGGGVQLRFFRNVVLDIEVSGGTEQDIPCGFFTPPGTDCTPVDIDLTYYSALIGYQVAVELWDKWRVSSTWLGGMSILESSSAKKHLAGAFGLEASRTLVGSLRLGLASRAWLLVTGREHCLDCTAVRENVIPGFDVAVMISFLVPTT
jgi:hypothetical protein